VRVSQVFGRRRRREHFQPVVIYPKAALGTVIAYEVFVGSLTCVGLKFDGYGRLAHSVAEWAEDFDLAYFCLGQLLQYFGPCIIEPLFCLFTIHLPVMLAGLGRLVKWFNLRRFFGVDFIFFKIF
jgi:hypothetical protein